MNILLANMPIEFNRRESLEPPLGICYIAAMLRDLSGANTFLKDYEVSRFSDEKLKKDLDALPRPTRELLELDEYNVITLITSRGCPYNCIYCDKSISTRQVRFRSADAIFDEIKHIVTSLKRNRHNSQGKLYVRCFHFYKAKHS